MFTLQKELWSFPHNIETSERKISMIVSRDLKENKRQRATHLWSFSHSSAFLKKKL